jgi:hypothetical protein
MRTIFGKAEVYPTACVFPETQVFNEDVIMDLFMRLEASGISTWLRTSQSLWAFPFVLALHTVGLGLTAGGAVVVDLRILGGASHIPLKPLEKFFAIMWLGLALNIVSGLLLFAKEATTVGISGVFWVKITLIALSVWILARIKRTVFDDPRVDQQPIPNGTRALALLSILLWVGAITAGRLMAYVGPTQPEAGIIFGS